MYVWLHWNGTIKIKGVSKRSPFKQWPPLFCDKPNLKVIPIGKKICPQLWCQIIVNKNIIVSSKTTVSF
jgi:hypothetical protein